MLLVGVTGGIGSGKSTFAALMAERGAEVIDADRIGHDALLPGKSAWHSVVDQFGDDILGAGGMEIDRKRLGGIVFSDPKKLTALNAIVHPLIVREVADRLEALAGTDKVVVLDAALIVELGLVDGLDVLIGLVTDPTEREKRLVGRGMDPVDARARMAVQIDPAELVAKADIVVTNDGTLEDLSKKADAIWAQLQETKKS